jgi:hypothetical protein
MKAYKLLFCVVLAIVTVAEILAQDGLTKRTIEDFNTLEVNDGLVVFITQGSENSISAKEEILNKINYSISNNKLKISQGGGNSNTMIYLSVNNLTKIIANGIAEVKSSNTITSGNLDLKVTGASKANILYEGEKLIIDGSGASDIKAGGQCNELDVELSGASSLKAYKLNFNSGNVDISGSSSANLNANESDLNGKVTGVSSLYYTGEPKALNVLSSGISKIIKSNGLDIEAGDTTKLSFGKKKVIIFDKDEEIEIDMEIDGHNKDVPKSNKKKSMAYQSIWSGFEMGINGYLNENNSLGLADNISGFDLQYNKSIVVNLNFYEKRINLIKDNICLVTGLGSEINNYRFNSNMRMLPNTRPLETVLEDSLSYNKNKLTTLYLNAPLYLSFRTNKMKNGKQFSVSPGITAGWLVRSYQKRVIDDDGGKNKVRTRDDFNLQPFRFNASLRVSYGSFTAFANYSLNEMFYAGRGPELYPFSVGIQLINF